MMKQRESLGKGQSWADETVACPTFLQWRIDGGALKFDID